MAISRNYEACFIGVELAPFYALSRYVRYAMDVSVARDWKTRFIIAGNGGAQWVLAFLLFKLGRNAVLFGRIIPKTVYSINHEIAACRTESNNNLPYNHPACAVQAIDPLRSEYMKIMKDRQSNGFRTVK
jgi:hypothetical protein